MELIAILDSLKSVKSIDNLILSISLVKDDKEFTKRCNEAAHDSFSSIIREATHLFFNQTKLNHLKIEYSKSLEKILFPGIISNKIKTLSNNILMEFNSLRNLRKLTIKIEMPKEMSMIAEYL